MHLTKNHCGERNPPALREAGVGLVEILVTVLILAIGLLGIAGVQFMSKRANFEAVQRTTAAHLANDILERMRSNPVTLYDYSVNAALLGNGSIATDLATTDVVMHDLWEWERAIDGAAETTGANNTGGLVSPSACIYTTVPVAAVNKSGQYMVTIVWRGTAKLSDPVNPAAVVPVPDPYDCGRALASGIYNSDDPAPVVDAHRRILVVDTYIAQ